MPELGIGLGISKGAAPKTKLLLDKYNIDAAFSLRKVRAEYSGPCVRVRNSSGDLADIGFTSNGTLDVDALNAHCGDNDGTVQTWYNQSTEGGRFNAVQNTVAAQPVIYDASEGGYLGYLNTNQASQPQAFDLENIVPNCPSIFAVYQIQADSGTNNYLVSGSQQGITHRDVYNETGITWFENDTQPYLALYNDGVDYDKKYMLAGYAGGATNFLTLNGYVAASDTDAAVDGISVNALMGRGGGARFRGKVWEIFLSTSDLSANRIAIENSILAANGLTVPEKTLLEKYGSGAVAYSFRSVNREYVGPIISLDCATDTPTLENPIYLTSEGKINVQRITDLCTNPDTTTSNGYVRVWYDQSGQGIDASSTVSNAVKPAIFIGGTGIVLSNGEPAMLFNDFDTVLTTGAIPNNSGTSFVVYSPKEYATTNTSHMFARSNGGNEWYLTAENGNTTSLVLLPAMTEGVTTVRISGHETITTPSTGRDTLYDGTTGKQSLVFVDGWGVGSYGWGISNYASSTPALDIEGYVQEWIWWEDSIKDSIDSIESSVNNHYMIYQEATSSPSSGFLADYSGAAAAYSVRQLGDANLCMKVRRSGDDATKNIGFGSDGFVDTTAISDFCGSDDGFVVTWYDQSGNAVDASQATASAQPKIYDGTDGIVKENGYPATEWSATPQPHLETSYTTNSSEFSVAAVARPNSTAANKTIVLVPEGLVFSHSTESLRYIQGNGTETVCSGNNFNAQSISFVGNSGSESFGVANSGIVYTTSEPPATFGQLKIGNNVNESIGFDGTIQEVVYYTSDQSSNRTPIEENINDAFNIYPDADTTPESGFLNEFSGAAAAYSVRKLGDSPVCMRVRKRVSLTDYFQVIGFDANGDLDTAAIEAFADGNDVFVQTWYDQSGNGRHATQDTNTFQPKIYDGTNGIVKENDKPSLDFNGTDHYFDLDIYGFDDVSTFEVLSTSDAQWIGLNQQGNAYAYTYDAGSTSTALTQNFGTSPSLYVNSSLVATGNDTNRDVTHTATSDGNQKVISTVAASTALWTDSKWSGFSNWYFDGTLQELIVFDSDQTSNRSLIEDNINNYYLTYQVASTAPATGLLAAHPAEAAYSVRQLGDALLCMKVASGAAGNPTKNIGFKNGVLDTAAIEEFCGNNDGFVATWYDQSGNNRNGSQSTHANRPKIFDQQSGILRENNKPIITGGLASQHLEASAINAAETEVFAVCQVESSFGYAAMISGGTGEYPITAQNGNTATILDSNSGTVSRRLDSSSWSATNRDQVYDALSDNQSLVGLSFDSSTWPTFYIGYTGNAALTMFSFQELIAYTSDQSANRTDIETNVNNYFKIYTPFTTGLLDSYPGAAAAYSLRRLSSTYTGDAIEVTSNGSTKDIGFDSEGNLDTSTLESFCGANDGTISKWYDQSGNGNDLVQATDVQQPKIYDGTTGLVTETGEPAIDFTAANGGLFTSQQWITGTVGRSIVAVGRADSTAVNTTIATVAYDVAPDIGAAMYLTAEAAVRVNGNVVYDKDFGSVHKLLFYSLPESSNLVSGTLHVNGVAASISSSVDRAIDTADFGYSAVGNVQLAASSYTYDGTLQEVLVYDSDQSTNRSGIEKNINSHYSIYEQPLLDVVPDAAAAYSLRKLRAGYTGPAINVYNGTDYKDIYFKSDGTLDTGAISRFCGSNDGTVAIWYDQSGNNNHAEQTDTSLMPKVYDGATGLVTENGKPIVDFYNESSNIHLDMNHSALYGQSNFNAYVASTTSDTSHLMFFGSNDDYAFVADDGSTVTVKFQDFGSASLRVNGVLQTLDASVTRDDIHTYLDGATIKLERGSTAAWTAFQAFNYNGAAPNNFAYTGKVHEMVFYNTDTSSSDVVIESNMNHYYSIY